jgi:Rod binding domain-containing protein
MNIDLRTVGPAVELSKRAAPELEKLKKATQSFEAVFLKKLFSTMRESVHHVKQGQTAGDDIYNDMFDQTLADSASKSGSYGISSMLYKSFAPKIVAMEQLKMRLEQSAKLHSACASQADRPKAVGDVLKGSTLHPLPGSPIEGEEPDGGTASKGIQRPASGTRFFPTSTPNDR